jgi:hypothetical protein
MTGHETGRRRLSLARVLCSLERERLGRSRSLYLETERERNKVQESTSTNNALCAEKKTIALLPHHGYHTSISKFNSMYEHDLARASLASGWCLALQLALLAEPSRPNPSMGEQSFSQRQAAVCLWVESWPRLALFIDMPVRAFIAWWALTLY